MEGVAGHLHQPLVIAHKDVGQRRGQQPGQGRHRHAHPRHKAQALLEDVAHLGGILRAIVVADDGGGADGVADENSEEDKIDVHEHTVGGHAVLSRQPQELEVEEHTDHRAGNTAHHLGRTVGTGLNQGLDLHFRGAQTQNAVVGPQEVEQRQHAAHRLADPGSQCRPSDPPAEARHKQGVQGHVGHPGAHRGQQAKLRPLGGGEECLKQVLEHEHGVERQNDAAIENTVAHHFRRRS